MIECSLRNNLNQIKSTDILVIFFVYTDIFLYLPLNFPLQPKNGLAKAVFRNAGIDHLFIGNYYV